MKIPLVDLKANYLSIKSEIDNAIQEVLDKTSFVMGPFVEEFDRLWAEYCQTKHAIGVANGTEAVRLAVRALGIKGGDEVITVSNTFIATTEAISDSGATPVFVDVDEDTCLMQTNQIESRITDKTRAIVCVHLYGHPCDMNPIMELARQRNLKVIEDCAQAHGARYDGKILGSIGDAGCFSMFPAKTLGAFGDAGSIITNDTKTAGILDKLRNHGRISKYESEFEGYNSRIDALQAKILTTKLAYLNQWIERRRSLASRYNEFLKDYVKVPVEKESAFHTYYMYVIRTENRDALQSFLTERRIGSGIHYPIPLHLQPAYRSLGYTKGSLPVTEKVSREILSIPLYPELSTDQQDYIIEAITDFFNQ